MKKLLFAFLLMCVSMFVAANQTISIGGTVTDINTGLAVPFQMIFISTDSASPSSAYFKIVKTGLDGTFTDVFEVSGNSPDGVLNVFIIDCFGLVQSQQLPFGNGNYTLTADFQICTVNTLPYDCYADFWWWQNTNLLVQRI